jgi:hypothetical protein
MFRSDKVEIRGDRNLNAGNDIIIHEAQSLRDRIREQFVATDNRINAIIPRKILSPRRNFSLEAFSSEKLFTSLITIGILVEAAWQVTESLDQHLIQTISSSDVVTTAHIRKAVSAAIYRLEGFSPHAVQEWGDLYARRYGSPDERLKVIHQDGSEEDLDYRFLYRHLIPHLVERILNVESYESVRKTLGSMSIRRIADQILAHVKSLNLYSLRYKTLLYLAHDLATQPPHPWFVETPYFGRTVAYDLDRAMDHANQLDNLLALGDTPGCTHAVYETVHHSCSAILAYYGAFLGSKHLESLPKLINVLQIASETGNHTLWAQCKIRQIDGDLQGIGLSRASFVRRLAKISKRIPLLATDDLEGLVRDARFIADTSSKLIRTREESIEKQIGNHDSMKELAPERFATLTREVFTRIPRLRTSDSSLPDGWFWVTHNVNSAVFRTIGARVLVVLVDTRAAVEVDEMKLVLTRAFALLKNNEHFANTVLVVTPTVFSDQCRRQLRAISTKEAQAFPILLRELMEVHHSDERQAALEDLLVLMHD